MANTATEIDWDSPVTKKHIEEAKAVGLTPDFIENPEIVWSLEDFERDNF